MHRCHDCQHYLNLTRKATGGGVEFSRAAFLAWRRVSPYRRRCLYCGIGGEQLYALNIENPRTLKRYEVVGGDRRDNTLPYRPDSIDPCCPLCNQIKSQLLTHEEMLVLGPHLCTLWDARLVGFRRGYVGPGEAGGSG